MIANWKTTLLIFIANIAPCGASSQISIFKSSTKPVIKCKSYIERIYETGTNQAVLVEKLLYRFDQFGKVKEKIVYSTLDSNVADYTINHQYEEGLLVEESSENKFKTSYLYNERGSLLAKKSKFRDNQYLDRYEYDERNNLSNKFHYNKDGQLKSSEKYTYNDRNRLIKLEYTDIDSVSNNKTTGYTRDSDGNILQERIYASNGHIISSRSYQYDSFGNLTEERTYSPGGVLRTRKRYRYTYDATGNWVSCDQTSDNASYRTVRTFTY